MHIVSMHMPKGVCMHETPFLPVDIHIFFIRIEIDEELVYVAPFLCVWKISVNNTFDHFSDIEIKLRLCVPIVVHLFMEEKYYFGNKYKKEEGSNGCR